MSSRKVWFVFSVLAAAAFTAVACSKPTDPTSVLAPSTAGAVSLTSVGSTDVVTTAGAGGGHMCVLANGSTVPTGFDQYGYNRCAHIFNGSWEGYCTEPKRNAEPDCYGVRRDTKLNMKWNEEWDRGNATGWSQGPYDAYLDNETRGYYTDGTPFSEHFKTRWDAGCTASNGAVSSNGGSCIWGQFEILMDQGKEDGVHFWWTKLSPAGYGN